MDRFGSPLQEGAQGTGDHRDDPVDQDVVEQGAVQPVHDAGELGAVRGVDSSDERLRPVSADAEAQLAVRGCEGRDQPLAVHSCEPGGKRALVLVDYDGYEGELTLIRDGEATSMSKNVRPDSYQFTVQLPTVTILSDLDEETGTATLKLRELDTENESVVSEGVSEVLEVSWPKSGLLYSIPAGVRAGIWFTEAH